jgi:hypothetical protein
MASFVSGSFFPQVRVFNNFPASFSGSFLAIYVAFPCVFNNFSGSFFKKGILFYFFISSVPKNRRSQALEKDYHTRPVSVKQIRLWGCVKLRVQGGVAQASTMTSARVGIVLLLSTVF